uniref:CopG family transcriptional regulator n=1 Tax=Candidatus Kentrum sp. DK TaxID=2126562 RepID=A0A450TLF6_9GAMM|nr:MAG: hypothetical protein BECKDK2373B_GA0170837_12152 [Candidatus Kentron sp. DK]
MTKKINYTDEPMDRVKVIADFLPGADELVPREETVEVTLRLSRSSVEFFKERATADHSDYRQAIRCCLDDYAFHGQTY